MDRRSTLHVLLGLQSVVETPLCLFSDRWRGARQWHCGNVAAATRSAAKAMDHLASRQRWQRYYRDELASLITSHVEVEVDDDARRGKS